MGRTTELLEAFVVLVGGGEAEVLNLPPGALGEMVETILGVHVWPKTCPDGLGDGLLEVHDDCCWVWGEVELMATSHDSLQQHLVDILCLGLHTSA